MTELTFATPEAWHAERARNIGGTESPILLRVAPSYAMSPWTLYQVKAGHIPPPKVDGERIDWGLRLEAPIATAAAEQEGWKIRKGGYYRHPRIDGMGTSLDYLIEGSRPGILECKNVDALTFDRSWQGDLPTHYHVQVQHQLACTDYEWAAVAVLVGGNHLEMYLIERRPGVIVEIQRRIMEFWASVRRDEPPPVDDSASTAAAIAALFPAPEPGKTYELAGEEDLSLWEDLRQAQLDTKAADAQERAAKNRLLAKIGNSELISYEGKIVGSYKQQTRKEHIVRESTFRVLRIKDA
jgi:predicted phage-related endonuclease